MEKKFFYFVFYFSFLFFHSTFSQPIIEWQKCLGGGDNDNGQCVIQTQDGGYIVAGSTFSMDGDVTGQHFYSLSDCWIIKLNSIGSIEWQKCLGGTGDDGASSIAKTSDGGYVIAGGTKSNNGDVSGNHGGYDYWIVKLSDNGSIQWQKCLGGTSDDYASSIQQTSDGGYVVTGKTLSNNGDVSGAHGMSDWWIVKLDAGGNLQWQKCLGGTGNDESYSIQHTTDGGYIAAGFSCSDNGDVSGQHGSAPYVDYWVVKLDILGNIEWQKCLGGTNVDVASSAKQTSDGGYIVAGYTQSNDGDVAGNHGMNDYWVVKLDPNGTIQWQKCFGGTSSEVAYCIEQTSDGGFLIAGDTGSNDGYVSGNHGQADYWIIKLDKYGEIEWQKCMGGRFVEWGFSIQQTDDRGYIIVGFSDSYDNSGDVSGHHGYTDCWVVKLAPYVGIWEDAAFCLPNPFSDLTTIRFNKNIVEGTLRFYNMLSQKVIEKDNINGNIIHVNAENLRSGVYIFEIAEDGKTIYIGKAMVY
jgi:hypothetical protein